VKDPKDLERIRKDVEHGGKAGPGQRKGKLEMDHQRDERVGHASTGDGGHGRSKQQKKWQGKPQEPSELLRPVSLQKQEDEFGGPRRMEVVESSKLASQSFGSQDPDHEAHK
jgi:hypothetical protein